MFSIINAGVLKTGSRGCIGKYNHFHRVLVVVRPVKPLFDFPKSIIAAGVSRKRSRVALSEDPRFLFLGDSATVPSFSLAT